MTCENGKLHARSTGSQARVHRDAHRALKLACTETRRSRCNSPPPHVRRWSLGRAPCQAEAVPLPWPLPSRASAAKGSSAAGHGRPPPRSCGLLEDGERSVRRGAVTPWVTHAPRLPSGRRWRAQGAAHCNDTRWSMPNPHEPRPSAALWCGSPRNMQHLGRRDHRRAYVVDDRHGAPCRLPDVV